MAAAVDAFKGARTEAPATGGEAVVPHATNNQTKVSRALWVGVAGDVTCILRDNVGTDTPTLFAALQIGWHPLRIARVNAVGTTATNMTVVW